MVRCDCRESGGIAVLRPSSAVSYGQAATGLRAELFFLFTVWLVKILEPYLSSSPLMFEMGIMTVHTMQGQCEANQMNVCKICGELCRETIA